MTETAEITYQPRGAAWDLFKCRDSEVLIEGPAGTGKTRAVLEYINWLCETYPGIRVLMCRQTLNSLKESVLVTWEEKVLWPDHPLWKYSGDATRENRTYYSYPPTKNEVDGVVFQGESHIVLGGLDKPEKTFSTEYDIVVFFEAIETNLDAWEKILRVNRNWKMPWQQAIADTNPGSEYHWLNQRANQPYRIPEGMEDVLDAPRPGQTQMTRLMSVHTDNPMMYTEDGWTEDGAKYIAKLNAMSGARRDRLLKGLWISEEGLVWEEYDPKIHLIPGSDVPICDYYIGGFDWGWTEPATFQLWGAHEGSLYLVHERYHTERRMDWWAGKICDAVKEYGIKEGKLRAIVMDPSEPERIQLMNDRLGEMVGRDMPALAIKANNAITAGVDLVGDKFKAKEMFLSKHALVGRDQSRIDYRQPTCFAEEIMSYVWPKREDGKAFKSKPDPSCEDHGCDVARYVAMYHWGKDTKASEPIEKIITGSYADVLRHKQRLLNVKRRYRGLKPLPSPALRDVHVA